MHRLAINKNTRDVIVIRLCNMVVVIAEPSSDYSAVGMAGDSADASLLTSAIEEDFTESPNVECPERSEIHRRYDHPIEDAPRKRRNENRNAALLSDFDDIIDYIDCCSLTQIWLSRIRSKFDIAHFYLKANPTPLSI